MLQLVHILWDTIATFEFGKDYELARIMYSCTTELRQDKDEDFPLESEDSSHADLILAFTDLKEGILEIFAEATREEIRIFDAQNKIWRSQCRTGRWTYEVPKIQREISCIICHEEFVTYNSFFLHYRFHHGKIIWQQYG